MESFEGSRLKKSIHKHRKTKVRGLLTTTETEKQKRFWVKREQQRFRDTQKVKIGVNSSDLQKNEEGVYICKDRVKGAHLTYIPRAPNYRKKNHIRKA